MKTFTVLKTMFGKRGIPWMLWLFIFEIGVGIILLLFSEFSLENSVLNLEQIGTPPFAEGFLLGSDQLGRSVFWQLVLGMQSTVLLPLFGILLASALGTILGITSGYLGDHQLKFSTRIFLSAAIFFVSFLFLSNVTSFHSSLLFDWIIPVGLSITMAMIPVLFMKKKRLIVFPFDLTTSRMVEIYMTLPPIFLVILLTSIFRPSPLLFVIYCTLGLWPEFFLFSRAEALKIKEVNFVVTAEAIGQRRRNILFRHLLPNISAPILVLASFGFARLMIIEATLSFLGIGLPPEYPGWGKMILAFRENPSYWWLLGFPGLLLFINIISAQKLGRWIEKPDKGR